MTSATGKGQNPGGGLAILRSHEKRHSRAGQSAAGQSQSSAIDDVDSRVQGDSAAGNRQAIAVDPRTERGGRSHGFGGEGAGIGHRWLGYVRQRIGSQNVYMLRNGHHLLRGNQCVGAVVLEETGIKFARVVEYRIGIDIHPAVGIDIARAGLRENGTGCAQSKNAGPVRRSDTGYSRD